MEARLLLGSLGCRPANSSCGASNTWSGRAHSSSLSSPASRRQDESLSERTAVLRRPSLLIPLSRSRGAVLPRTERRSRRPLRCCQTCRPAGCSLRLASAQAPSRLPRSGPSSPSAATNRRGDTYFWGSHARRTPEAPTSEPEPPKSPPCALAPAALTSSSPAALAASVASLGKRLPTPPPQMLHARQAPTKQQKGDFIEGRQRCQALNTSLLERSTEKAPSP